MSRLIRGLLSASGSSSIASAGQALFIESGTEEWIVPEGVFSISVVLVGRGGLRLTGAADPGSESTELKRGNEVLLFAENGSTSSRLGISGASGSPIGGAIGGGDGGRGASSNASRSDIFRVAGGGGGAGGYSGNGGSASGGSGSGGGGAGGFSRGGSVSNNGDGGGGVGLNGEGLSGTSAGQGGSGGTDGVVGAAGVPGAGGNYGGGQPGISSFSDAATFNAGGGGALRYYNNLPVTPGETLTIVKPANVAGVGSAAARIIWPGDERQFPNTRTEDE